MIPNKRSNAAQRSQSLPKKSKSFERILAYVTISLSVPRRLVRSWSGSSNSKNKTVRLNLTCKGTKKQTAKDDGLNK